MGCREIASFWSLVGVHSGMRHSLKLLVNQPTRDQNIVIHSNLYIIIDILSFDIITCLYHRGIGCLNSYYERIEKLIAVDTFNPEIRTLQPPICRRD